MPPQTSQADLVAGGRLIAEQGEERGDPRAKTVEAVTRYFLSQRPGWTRPQAHSLAVTVYLTAANRNRSIIAEAAADPVGSFVEGVTGGNLFEGITGAIFRVGVGAIGLSLLAIGLIMLAKGQGFDAASSRVFKPYSQRRSVPE